MQTSWRGSSPCRLNAGAAGLEPGMWFLAQACSLWLGAGGCSLAASREDGQIRLWFLSVLGHTWLLCFYTGEGPGAGMVLEAPGSTAYLVYLLMSLGPGSSEAERMTTSHDRGWAWAAPGCHPSPACPYVGRGTGFHLLVLHSFIHQICMGYLLCQVLF